MVNRLRTSFKILKFVMSRVPKCFSNYKYVNGVSIPDKYRHFLWKAVGGSGKSQVRVKKIPVHLKLWRKAGDFFFFSKGYIFRMQGSKKCMNVSRDENFYLVS